MKRSTGEWQGTTFIVRLWQEPRESQEDEAVWRGTATHVQSGTERGIKDWDELKRFMQTWTQTRDLDR
ncbi:MAG: hypothetical protein JXQ72_04810 [Anaerolineae bacterium]|nr:hypothetical protein [Anaerolineae bacterium]